VRNAELDDRSVIGSNQGVAKQPGDHPGLRPLAKWVRHGNIRIEDPAVEVRLDRYLAGRFTYRSRTGWVRMIEAQRILVNGRPCRPSRVVRTGDGIGYVPRREPEPPVTVEIPRLWDDEFLLAVNKPPNLPVHPSGRYFQNTLLCILLAQRGETLDEPGIRIVHRLDRETSGVVVFGKTRLAAAFLARQFERHRVEKEYLLIAHGLPEEDSFTVAASLGAAPASRVRKAVGVVPAGEGRPARTDFVVLARGPEHSLLSARPRTGRLHQIRVHARHAGFPVVGDKLYGLDERLFLKLAAGESYSEEDHARLLLGRQCLHAWRLRLEHPQTREPFELIAPLPADMEELAQRLSVPLPATVRG
jgi:23S rRNA pseudouridine1911/1915/1917 synthase